MPDVVPATGPTDAAAERLARDALRQPLRHARPASEKRLMRLRSLEFANFRKFDRPVRLEGLGDEVPARKPQHSRIAFPPAFHARAAATSVNVEAGTNTYHEAVRTIQQTQEQLLGSPQASSRIGPAGASPVTAATAAGRPVGRAPAAAASHAC